MAWIDLGVSFYAVTSFVRLDTRELHGLYGWYRALADWVGRQTLLGRRRQTGILVLTSGANRDLHGDSGGSIRQRIAEVLPS